MLAVERKNLILERLQEQKRVVVSELSELFDVSEETIRRDLDKLEKEGFASKTYGGAVLVENNNTDMPGIRRDCKRAFRSDVRFHNCRFLLYVHPNNCGIINRGVLYY